MFSKKFPENKRLIVVTGVIIVIVLAIWAGLYEHSRTSKVSKKLDLLSQSIVSLASTTAQLQADIAKTNSSLSNGLNEQKQSVGAIQQQLGNYAQTIGSINTTVSTLQKLSKTDPQLLQKYSKVFFLNENYIPTRVTEIPEAYKYSSTKAVSIHAEVWPYLQTLIDDAKKAGITLFVSSGYRPFAEQKALKGDYRIIYGAGTANQFSADQGYSEHQLGTALDFITTGLGGQLDGFDGTPAYPWLLANAYRYGFIISYPKDNKYYVFEPWHWRFVGVKLATDLRNQNQNFYDLDQRKIDEYLVNIFD